MSSTGIGVSVASPVDAVTSSRRAAVLVAYAILLAVGYYVAARLGLGFRFQNSQVGVVWPAAAVLLSALLLTPRTRWWVVLAATAVAHAAAVGASVPAWRLAWQIAGNAAFTMTMAEVLRRFAGLPLNFGSRWQVVVYMAASFGLPTLFAFTTAAFVRSALHLETVFTPAVAVLRTTLSNATAMLLTAPVILLWADGGVRRLRALGARRLVEAALTMLSLLAVGLIAFGTGPEIARFPWLLLWIFPPLLWAAVRFGPIGASTSLFCVAALSMWGTARQLGPFVLTTHADMILSLQLFWIVLCPPVMLLAAVIREREQIEDALEGQRNQLAHVTRVATIGELSGALAHELRQPLTAIMANANAGLTLLGRQPVDLGELREILQDITLQDTQAANVIDRLRSFLRAGDSRFETLAVDTVVRDALALGRSTIEITGVDVQTRIASALPRVRGDQVQLLQVILNLIVNGCESMSGRPASARHLSLQVARRDSDHVEVLIADEGTGLPEGCEERVFDPFFTTKDTGLGLGLAICRSIAAAHHGRLWGENNPRGGATFHLLLPADLHLGTRTPPALGQRGAQA